MTITADEAALAPESLPQYAALAAPLEEALAATEEIAALPADAAEWSSDQRTTATQAQRSIDTSIDTVIDECTGVTDPWRDAGDEFALQLGRSPGMVVPAL